jgi:CRP-like cAMP-binding protein
MEALLQFLHSIYPLSPSLSDHLSLILKKRDFARGEYLLQAGRVSGHIYFIEKGLIRCFYRKGNKEICSWFMKESDVIVSVQSFFKQKPSYENIQAMEDCVVHYISYSELQQIYNKYLEFNIIGRKLLENYYALSEERLYSMRMLKGSERYQYVMEFHPELIKRVPSKFLATYLGLTEVTLSRVKAKR